MSNDQPGWTPPQQPETPPAGGTESAPSGADPYGQAYPSAAQPAAPYGQPSYGQPTPPYGQQAYGQSPYGGSLYSSRGDARPGTVTAAGIITIALSALSGALFLLITVVALAAKADMLDRMGQEVAKSDSGITTSDLDSIYGVVVVVFIIVTVWCLIALLLGIFALRRSNIARVLLTVSSAVTALVSLIGITSGVSVITLVAAIAVIVLLFTGGANDWFARRGQQFTPTYQPY